MMINNVFLKLFIGLATVNAMYSIPPLSGLMIRSQDDPSLCLTSSGDYALTLSLQNCDVTNMNQRWNKTERSHLTLMYGESPTFPHACVTTSTNTGSRHVSLQACGSSTEQVFDFSNGLIRPINDPTQCLTVFVCYQCAPALLTPCSASNTGTQHWYMTYTGLARSCASVTTLTIRSATQAFQGYDFTVDGYSGVNPTLTLSQGCEYSFELITNQPIYLIKGLDQFLLDTDGFSGSQGSTSGSYSYKPPMTGDEYTIHYTAIPYATLGGNIVVVPAEPSFVNLCATNNGGCGAQQCRLSILQSSTIVRCGCPTTSYATAPYWRCDPMWPNTCSYWGPDYVSGGSWSTAGTNEGFLSTLTCSGSNTKLGYDAYCSSNGDWDGSGTCSLVGCESGPLPPPHGSYYNCYNVGEGSSCILVCDYGYSRNGADPQCLGNDQWSTAPTCVPNGSPCYDIPTVPGGDVYCGTNYPVYDQTICQCSCDSNYYRYGYNPVCQDGVFSQACTCSYDGVASTAGPPDTSDPTSGDSNPEDLVLGLPVWLLVGVACMAVMCLIFCALLCQSVIIKRRARLRMLKQAREGGLDAAGEILEGRGARDVQENGPDELQYLGCTPEGVENQYSRLEEERFLREQQQQQQQKRVAPLVGEGSGGEGEGWVAGEEVIEYKQQQQQQQQQQRWWSSEQARESVHAPLLKSAYGQEGEGGEGGGETGVDDETLYGMITEPVTTLKLFPPPPAASSAFASAATSAMPTYAPPAPGSTTVSQEEEQKSIVIASSVSASASTSSPLLLQQDVIQIVAPIDILAPEQLQQS